MRLVVDDTFNRIQKLILSRTVPIYNTPEIAATLKGT